MRDRRRGRGAGACEARRALAKSFSKRNLATTENQRVELTDGQPARVPDLSPTFPGCSHNRTRHRKLRLNGGRPLKKASSLRTVGFGSLCKVNAARALIARQRPPTVP